MNDLTPILEYAANSERAQRQRWHLRPGVRVVGGPLYPLVCRGYDRRQDALVRGFVGALLA